jgi:uncharacterized protein (DUF934 family)
VNLALKKVGLNTSLKPCAALDKTPSKRQPTVHAILSVSSLNSELIPMKILSFNEHAAGTQPSVISIPNDADPRTVSLDGVTRIDLHFPKFTDGRAYSQAFLLRRRLGFKGEIRATGDVLIDQLVSMARTGFDVAVLREGLDASAAQRQFDRFPAYYQGSAVDTQPLFAKAVA